MKRVAGLAFASLVVVATRAGPLHTWLVTNGAQDDYPCRVASRRFSDIGLSDQAAAEELLRNHLYVGNVRPNDPIASWAAELRSGPVGVPVSGEQLKHTVPTYVQPPLQHSAIDNTYALVGVDDQPVDPRLGYLIAYGKHQGLDPQASPVPPGAGIELVKRCSIQTPNGPVDATVYAGSVSSTYQLRTGTP